MYLLSLICVNARGQSGIRFQQLSNWNAVIAKAKAEHKYIFVDCYATWCIPCKWMDDNVYTSALVGDLYNKEFVSVRLQMDKIAKDAAEVKSWYGTAQLFERNYFINAYPTFLFFDTEGKPVHKVSGSLNWKKFMSLAKDAFDPNMQYYRALKTFKPNTLDTAEEKGLARSFVSADKVLGGKIAADYLSRIPSEQLKKTDNLQLMIQFRDNEDIVKVALSYLTGLKNNQFTEKRMVSFLVAMGDRAAIKALVLNFANTLQPKDVFDTVNQNFLQNFSSEPIVQKVAKTYIDQLSEDSLYTPRTLEFIRHFNQSKSDRAFDVFYHHADKVDKILGIPGYAHSRVVRMVITTEFTPLLKKAERNNKEPNWQNIHKYIAGKFDVNVADEVLVQGKVDWNEFLVQNQKDEQYWPEFVDAQFNRVVYFRWDTVKAAYSTVNDVVFTFIFLHSDKPEQLKAGVDWMKTIVKDHPDNMDVLDTYACILYKTGEFLPAIRAEEKVLEIASQKNDQYKINYTNQAIATMREGGKIWLKPPFVN